jgi:glutamate/tyrosine decarboxylase-like PLP-dependent enzyme
MSPLWRDAVCSKDDDLRLLFADVVEKAVRFRSSVGELPQRPSCSYRQMQERIDPSTPEAGFSGLRVIDELAALAEPGLHAMVGPRFFGWVVGASHPVGVAADWLTGAWGQNSGNHEATPAAAAIEEIAAKWLVDILDLPRECSVGFVTGATMANFVCLAAARSKVLRDVGWDVERYGLFGAPVINVLIGEDAHTTVFAALQMLGLGHDRVHRVPTDDAGRIKLANFCEILANCQGPTIAIAQAGQINTGAFDPISTMADETMHRSAWLHVDGAFGLWARACPQKAHLALGIDKADSWAVDGHKWLQTPYDCGYAIVAHPDDHRRSMTAEASYLPSALNSERAPSHFVPELSRRARGFATWAMIRHLGRGGIAEMVSRHCRLARRMAERLSEEPGIVVINDVELNQVIVRFGGAENAERGDDLTAKVIARVQAGGACFVGGARWRGRWVMRVSVISWPTTDADADASTDAIIQGWRSEDCAKWVSARGD